MEVHHGVCVGVRGPLWIFLSTLWFLGLKLRSSRLVVGAFTYRSILLALDCASLEWNSVAEWLLPESVGLLAGCAKQKQGLGVYFDKQ